MAFFQNLGHNWNAANKAGLVLLALGVAVSLLAPVISRAGALKRFENVHIAIRFIGLFLAMAGTLWTILG